MTPYLLIAALVLPGVALAHDPVTAPRYEPVIEWLDGPDADLRAGSTRIRIVRHGQTEIVALTLNQTYLYETEYNKRLTQLSMQMPVSQARGRAAQDAIQRVMQVFPPNRVSGLDRAPLLGGRISYGE